MGVVKCGCGGEVVMCVWEVAGDRCDWLEMGGVSVVWFCCVDRRDWVCVHLHERGDSGCGCGGGMV